MVTDYTNHGTRLVESYEKSLQEQLEFYRANNDRRNENLLKVFEKAQVDRAMTSKAVTHERVRDMKVQWQRQQEALGRSMAAAIEACVE